MIAVSAVADVTAWHPARRRPRADVTAAEFEAAIRGHALRHPGLRGPAVGAPGVQAAAEPGVRVHVGARGSGAAHRQARSGGAGGGADAVVHLGRQYVGRYGWVTVQVVDDDVLTMALDWVAESWWLKATAAQRTLLEP